jgi:hypothetical protein
MEVYKKQTLCQKMLSERFSVFHPTGSARIDTDLVSYPKKNKRREKKA